MVDRQNATVSLWLRFLVARVRIGLIVIAVCFVVIVVGIKVVKVIQDAVFVIVIVLFARRCFDAVFFQSLRHDNSVFLGIRASSCYLFSLFKIKKKSFYFIFA